MTEIKIEDKQEYFTNEYTFSKIGVIRLPTFYLDFEARRRGDQDTRSATADVAKHLQELKKENVCIVVRQLLLVISKYLKIIQTMNTFAVQMHQDAMGQLLTGCLQNRI